MYIKGSKSTNEYVFTRKMLLIIDFKRLSEELEILVC